MLYSLSKAPFLFWWIAVTNAAAAINAGAPVIDLGYESHVAQTNMTGGYHRFYNIRYAAPPARFEAPKAPSGDYGLRNGSQSVICPQAFPGWLTTSTEFLSGKPITNNNTENFTVGNIPPADPRTSEDCLFLDIVTPISALNRSQGLPVLVWIHGGGYTLGSKDYFGDGAGLVERSMEGGNQGIVFVAINYRLGLFGWLAGERFSRDGGISNAGLLDQQFALEWIQKYIHLFGGNCENVTVIGESAGGGSVLNLLTSPRPTRFHRVIAQSAFLTHMPNESSQESILTEVMEISNATTFSDLQKIPFDRVQLANALVVGRSPYGSFTFGPTLDGNTVRGSPERLLAQGKFDTSIQVMIGHNFDEGLLFTPPTIDNSSSSYISALDKLLPESRPSQLSFIEEDLYPPFYNGTYGYTSPISRYATMFAEMFVTCNTLALNEGVQNSMYVYMFSVPPALHGNDVGYTLFNGVSASNGASINSSLAELMQRYFVNFATSGVAAEPINVPVFEEFQVEGRIMNFNVSGSGMQNESISYSSAAKKRCQWWQDNWDVL